MPAPFRLYNTRTRKTEDFAPLVPGKVGLYVCGMTVYDDCHIGHARAMVIYDTLVLYLRHREWQVEFVRNFTDVDDKIIRRAAEEGEEPHARADRFISRFHEDMEQLGLMKPDAEPRVSGTIAEIQGLITKIEGNGHAYPAEGGVWFDVPSYGPYGALSGQKVEHLRSEDVGGGKRHPADFALWKAEKPGEPAWDSPWGRGRPGWHVECSAMAWATLGETIDIHGGGLDLVFPHHENEVAQSEGGHGVPFARYWMHNGMLTVGPGRKAGGQADREAQDDQVKMGKSLGNSVTIRALLQTTPAEALRLFYLAAHYRSGLPFDEDALPTALGSLARLYEAREVAEAMGGDEDPDGVARALGADALNVLQLGRAFSEQLYAALDDDFNTAAAIGHALQLARAVNRFSNHKKANRLGGPVVAPALAGFALLGPALGLLQLSTEAFHEEIRQKRLPLLGLTPERVEQLLEERTEARINKDWARADAIRDELEACSVAVMDGEGGSRWRVRL